MTFGNASQSRPARLESLSAAYQPIKSSTRESPPPLVVHQLIHYEMRRQVHWYAQEFKVVTPEGVDAVVGWVGLHSAPVAPAVCDFPVTPWRSVPVQVIDIAE